jgi:tRNA threonylcarbamoyladenosine biosynthesis protein TsaE
MIYYTNSASGTEEIGMTLARALERDGRKSAFIAMRGEMGVGKTAFVRGFAAHFGIAGVKSPTYTVVNEYRGRARIYHFDMYRITDGDDLYSIGYDDYVESDGYVLAEWSENVEDYIPEDAIYITISRTDGENGRKIEIDYENISI